MPVGRRKGTSHRTGQRAEAAARLWLRCKGWRILASRARTPVGEIDIIARRGRTLAFIEVKCRASLDEALHALRPRQRKRIADAAALWLAGNSVPQARTFRFDVIVIAGWRIRHLADAFHADEVLSHRAFSL